METYPTHCANHHETVGQWFQWYDVCSCYSQRPKAIKYYASFSWIEWQNIKYE